jgi:hypothetical protein
VIREVREEPTIAVFRAMPHIRQRLLEVDVPDVHDAMQLRNAERIVFERSQRESKSEQVGTGSSIFLEDV